jgi:hypothetical protein
MVALVQLGEPPGPLLQKVVSSRRIRAPADLEPLEPYLERALARSEHQSLRDGLRRLLQARFPLPVDQARRMSRLPEEHLPLLTRCIGWGCDVVRIDERVRRMLLRLTREADARRSPEPEAHLELARYHQKLDGALGIEQTRGAQVLNWLEKVHHLGHAGPSGEQDWSSLRLTAREFFWDRARALSMEQRDYSGAADVYQQCIDRVDAEDAYSWHYLAFNLDRAGRERDRAERAFHRAVELDRSNPWWNGRLVTFLIEQSRFREAESEWHEALERLDPDGSLVRSSSLLALNVHRWVVKAWLERGEVERARRAFDAIPPGLVGDTPRLWELGQQLQDAEEVRLLGESVYPASVPMEMRWTRPRFLEPLNQNGKRLREWFPGRVVHSSSKHVRVVVATPELEPAARRVVVRELSTKQWREYTCQESLPGADTFIEVGTYEDEAVRIVLAPGGGLGRGARLASARALRYLRRWST